MKKLLQACVCILLILGIMWAALQPSKTGQSEEPAKKEEKATIRIWYSDERLADYVNSAAVEFTQSRGIRVLPVYADDQTYLEKLNEASISSNQIPDLFLIGNESLEETYLAGLSAVLEEAIVKEESEDAEKQVGEAGKKNPADKYILNQDNFSETALNAITYHGKKVAYPLYFETCALVYNDSYLEIWAEQQAKKTDPVEVEDSEEGELEELDRLPEEEGSLVEYDEETIAIRKQQFWENAVPGSMDDLLYFADSFDPPEGVESVFAWDVSDILFNYYFVGDTILLGGACGDDRNVLDISNQKTLDSLKVFQSLNQFFFMEDQMKYEKTLQDFMEGKLVFTVVKPDAIKILEEAKLEGNFTYEYGFVTMPDPVEGIAGRSLSVTETVCVNGYSENKEIANEFARYLVKDYANELYNRSNKLPAAKTAIRSEGPQVVFATEYAGSVSLPKIMECSNYWLQMENIFSKIWKGGSVEEPVQELEELIRNQLAE